MARFCVFRRLAFFPLTATSRSCLTCSHLLFANHYHSRHSRRHFLWQVSTLSILAVASSFRPTPTALAAPAASRGGGGGQNSMHMTNNNDPNNNMAVVDELGFLNAEQAAALDEELMTQPGFTLEQLMELAGLSVAEAAYIMLSELPTTTTTLSNKKNNTKVLIVCGPGNNGGDGLVAARHLHHFGYETVVVYPKRSTRQAHYTNLVQQCQDLNISILDEMPKDLTTFALVVDAMFGFSFQGEPREPFRSILQTLQTWQEIQSENGNMILSVDVPSGWNVNQGDVTQSGFLPTAVISLTTPKQCMHTYTGRHFVGGRFLPPALATKYKVRMPPYPGVAQVWQVPRGGGGSSSGTTTTTTAQLTPQKEKPPSTPDDAAWQAGYAAYCAAKEAQLAKQDQADEDADARVQALSSSSWEAQYAAYCSEKEAKLAALDRADEASSWEAQYAAHCAEKEARLKESEKSA